MASARGQRFWSRPSRGAISFMVHCSNYFATSTEKFNLNQFGGSFGGPIKKDKTFFFVDYQAKMQRQGVPFTGFVPTTAMTTPNANGDYDYSQDPLGLARPGVFDGT